MSVEVTGDKTETIRFVQLSLSDVPSVMSKLARKEFKPIQADLKWIDGELSYATLRGPQIKKNGGPSLASANRTWWGPAATKSHTIDTTMPEWLVIKIAELEKNAS